MSQEPTEQSRLTTEDRALIRSIGTRLRRLIQGEVLDYQPSDRRDELGILANMINRVSKELRLIRQQEQKQRQQLEERLEQLRTAQDAHQRLQYTIEELSTPILNIYKGVSLLPIVGGMDDQRAEQMISALLEGVKKTRSQVVILDITGMSVIDTQVANALIRAAQATALLGARVILCGMTPDVAQVVVSLGINLAVFQSCSDLQAGLNIALRMTNHRIITT
jgi:rsbT co-antagonist protein RsbR